MSLHIAISVLEVSVNHLAVFCTNAAVSKSAFGKVISYSWQKNMLESVFKKGLRPPSRGCTTVRKSKKNKKVAVISLKHHKIRMLMSTCSPPTCAPLAYCWLPVSKSPFHPLLLNSPQPFAPNSCLYYVTRILSLLKTSNIYHGLEGHVHLVCMVCPYLRSDQSHLILYYHSSY